MMPVREEEFGTLTVGHSIFDLLMPALESGGTGEGGGGGCRPMLRPAARYEFHSSIDFNSSAVPDPPKPPGLRSFKTTAIARGKSTRLGVSMRE